VCHPLPAPFSTVYAGESSTAREWRNLADAPDLGSGARKGVGVQLPPLAPFWHTERRRYTTLSRSRALRTLEEEHESVRELAERLRNEDFERPATIGGGDWSAKDLLGHLASWEEHALEALKAWRNGESSPIQRALRVHGLNAVNDESVAADRDRSSATVRRRFDDIHRRLVAEIRSMPEATWDATPTTRSRRSLGHVLGGIVGGPGGPFTHASSHLLNLRAYVESVTDAGRPTP
jgi:SOS response regulatory protein OraA/RecX